MNTEEINEEKSEAAARNKAEASEQKSEAACGGCCSAGDAEKR